MQRFSATQQPGQALTRDMMGTKPVFFQPADIAAEFQRYLQCGVLRHGFAPIRCPSSPAG